MTTERRPKPNERERPDLELKPAGVCSRTKTGRRKRKKKRTNERTNENELKNLGFEQTKQDRSTEKIYNNIQRSEEIESSSSTSIAKINPNKNVNTFRSHEEEPTEETRSVGRRRII